MIFGLTTARGVRKVSGAVAAYRFDCWTETTPPDDSIALKMPEVVKPRRMLDACEDVPSQSELVS